MPELNQNSIHGREAFISLLVQKLTEGAEISVEDLRGLKQCLCGDDGASVVPATLPFLDKHFLKRQIDGTQIVRHIGMVQNMLDPEFYAGSLNGRSLHFRDYNPTPPILESNYTDDDCSTLSERQSLFIVPIPFTADWFKELLMLKVDSIDETTETAEPNMKTTSRKRELGTVHLKNAKQRSENVGTIDHVDGMDSGISKRKQMLERSIAWWPAGCVGSDEHISPVLAKFYYDQYSKFDKHPRNLRLNDVVETIGVLSMNPWEADFSAPGSSFEFDSVPPPPSQLPRLHVLAYRTIDLDTLAHEKIFASTANTQEIMGYAMYSGLKRSLASQAVFLTMLSKAERKANLVHKLSACTIGCASLKVSTTVDSRVVFRRLTNVLNQSCPVVAAVDLTSNEQHPFPLKSSGMISPTSWQLPAGSTLLLHLDDLRQDGLEKLLCSHQIVYTFEGGVQIPFEADYRIIVVSNNQNVKCSMHVCIEEEDLSLLEAEALSLRRTLASCRRIGNVQLSPEVLERSQDEFLSQRSSARSNPQNRMPREDDFHHWLCLTRLQARSRQSELAITEDWEQALAFNDGVWNVLDQK